MKQKRNVNDLFSELNKPIRNKNRAPVELDGKSVKTNAPLTPRKGIINALNFKTVELNINELETVLTSSRKDKEAIVQDWIEAFKPNHIQTLEKIAKESENHRRILESIINELKLFPDLCTDDVFGELAKDANEQSISCKVRILKLHEELKNLEEQKQSLFHKIEGAKFDISRSNEEQRKINLMIGKSKLAESVKKQIPVMKSVLFYDEQGTTDNTLRYNTAWGENKHLKSETKKLIEKINEERNYHLQYCMKTAERSLDPTDIQHYKQNQKK